MAGDTNRESRLYQHDQKIMKQLEGCVQLKKISWTAIFENYLEQYDIFKAKVPIARYEVLGENVRLVLIFLGHNSVKGAKGIQYSVKAVMIY